MSEKQFVVDELEILNEENEWKGEYWWAVVNTQRIEDCFECRNKEVALKLCDFLNKATDDFKWQIRQCEKWSAIVKQLEKENEQLRQQLKEYKENWDDMVELATKTSLRNIELDELIGQLKAQLREKEEDERLYANEIVKLNKEAKEVLDFKSLGGDY